MLTNWQSGAVAAHLDFDAVKGYVAQVKNRRLMLKPHLGKAGKIWEKIASSVDEHYRKEIFRSGPDDTESNSAYCQDYDGVGNGLERVRIGAESFNLASMAKDKTGSVRQAEDQRHQYNSAHFGFQCRGQA